MHFHFWLFLDFRTVFVEIKLPILLYYWITYFFIRLNKGWWKVSVFPSSAVHFRTNAANTMTFLQREFLPSNDIKFHLYLLYCHSSSSYLLQKISSPLRFLTQMYVWALMFKDQWFWRRLRSASNPRSVIFNVPYTEYPLVHDYSAVHFRTNAANTMTFLQREFLPSNDT